MGPGVPPIVRPTREGCDAEMPSGRRRHRGPQNGTGTFFFAHLR